MAKLSKREKAVQGKVDRSKNYAVVEALSLAKEFATAKFDESIDVAGAVKNAKAGQVQYRTDKGGIVHSTIGRASFEVGQLEQNLKALVDALIKAKPAAAKGQYLKKIAVSSTMGPGVRVDATTL